MAKKCENTKDWISDQQLRQYRLQKLRDMRDRKKHELNRLNEQIDNLERKISGE